MRSRPQIRLRLLHALDRGDFVYKEMYKPLEPKTHGKMKLLKIPRNMGVIIPKKNEQLRRNPWKRYSFIQSVVKIARFSTQHIPEVH